MFAWDFCFGFVALELLSALFAWELPLGNFRTCANHENEQLREVSVLLVYQQYETIGKSVQKHLDSFATLFNSGLQDSSVARVRWEHS